MASPRLPLSRDQSGQCVEIAISASHTAQRAPHESNGLRSRAKMSSPTRSNAVPTVAQLASVPPQSGAIAAMTETTQPVIATDHVTKPIGSCHPATQSVGLVISDPRSAIEVATPAKTQAADAATDVTREWDIDHAGRTLTAAHSLDGLRVQQATWTLSGQWADMDTLADRVELVVGRPSTPLLLLPATGRCVLGVQVRLVEGVVSRAVWASARLLPLDRGERLAVLGQLSTTALATGPYRLTLRLTLEDHDAGSAVSVQNCTLLLAQPPVGSQAASRLIRGSVVLTQCATA